MTHIKQFSEVGKTDVGTVGGKAANLGEMTQAGLPVPPGFCVAAGAYREFISATGLGDEINCILAGMNGDDPSEVDARAERVRTAIMGKPIPQDIEQETVQSYRKLAAALGQPDGTPIPVAVRSSATAEDLPNASFAGQQDTYLNVRGESDLLNYLKRCYASLWTGRAVTYRIKQGFAHEQVALAAVVQAMIESEVSGVMFTANPVTGNRDEAVINASWGLGEAIVSGIVTPDTLTVRKADGMVVDRQIASKDVFVQYAPKGGTIESPVAAERRRLPSLSDAQIAALGELARRIEEHYQRPMDIEWAFAGGRFYILQARPITNMKAIDSIVAQQKEQTQSAPPQNLPQHGEYNRTMFIEIFPDPISPVFLSVLDPLFTSMLAFTFKTIGFKPPEGMPAVGLFYSQPYFNRAYFEAALQPLSPAVRAQMVTQFVNPFGKHARGAPVELSPAFIGMAFRLLRLMRTFHNLLPKVVQQYRDDIKAFMALNLSSESDEQIIEQMIKLIFSTAGSLLNYDFLMIAMIGITYQTLGTMLERYFGDESEEIRSKLVSGVTGNVTMETNQRLWDLAQMGKKSAVVRAALLQSKNDALRSQLEQSEDGRAFQRELDRFLTEYGHREVRMDILYPTWSEDPAPVLSFLRTYLDLPDSQSPYHQQDRLVEQRKQLAAKVEQRVRNDLRGQLIVWPIFSWVLRHTQANTRLRDTMHFELTRLFPAFRRSLQELSKRWVAQGLLSQPDDVYYLTLDELSEEAKAHKDMRSIVQMRRAELEANRKRSAPGILRDGQAVAGEGAAQASTVAGQYRGIAGSPGTASGIARLVRGPEDFSKLQSGEILIAPLTNPVWTPLFAIAGGIVTEVGGILSHGAIVAREYGIPAVMGVAGATTAIVEGQRVTVDGNRGVVTVG